MLVTATIHVPRPEHSPLTCLQIPDNTECPGPEQKLVDHAADMLFTEPETDHGAVGFRVLVVRVRADNSPGVFGEAS